MRQVRIDLTENEWRQVRAAAIAAGQPIHLWLAVAALRHMNEQRTVTE